MGKTHFSGPVISAGGFQVTEDTAAGVTRAMHQRVSAPIAAELITIVADVAMAAGASIIAAQPDVPRKLQVRITDGDSSVSAGTATIVGVDQNGQAATEVVTLTGGTATKITTKAYATVTSITIAALAGNTGADHVSVGVGAALGLPSSGGFSGFTVYKESLNNVNEAVGTVDATAGTIIPTTAPDGARNFDFWYAARVPLT